MTAQFAGIFPALLTPLTAQGDLNRTSLALHLKGLYGAGADGVYVAGSTGEGLLLPLEVREALTRAVVELSPDRQVIVHVGANSTASATRLARHAERAGAHAISSIAPAGPFSFADIEAYYRELAASTTLPLILYFFPASAPAVAGYAQIEALCAIPNVIGVKFTSFDLYTLNRLKQLGKLVFNGHDEVLAAGLLMGADGGIGSIYNVEPELFVQLYRAARAGRWDEARALQDRVNQLITIVLGYPLFPALKQILQWRGIDCGACTPPYPTLREEQAQRLRQQLTTAGFAVA